MFLASALDLTRHYLPAQKHMCKAYIRSIGKRAPGNICHIWSWRRTQITLCSVSHTYKQDKDPRIVVLQAERLWYAEPESTSIQPGLGK